MRNKPSNFLKFYERLSFPIKWLPFSFSLCLGLSSKQLCLHFFIFITNLVLWDYNLHKVLTIGRKVLSLRICWENKYIHSVRKQVSHSDVYYRDAIIPHFLKQYDTDTWIWALANTKCQCWNFYHINTNTNEHKFKHQVKNKTKVLSNDCRVSKLYVSGHGIHQL